MYKFLFFLCVIPALCFSKEVTHTAKKIQFSGHSYICFDERYFLHDPDCYCFHLRGTIHKIDDTTSWIDISSPPSDM